MKKPTKLKPRTLDITFCNSPARNNEKCAICERNLRRYAFPKSVAISIIGFNAWPNEEGCGYFIPDERAAK